jgi:hypothetical protein
MSHSLEVLAVVTACLTLGACGATPDASPAAPAPALTTDVGDPTASGYGRGSGGPTPLPAPGTCTGECDGGGAGPGSGNGQGPGNGAGPGPGDGFCDDACNGSVGPDPADIREMLERALQEEYKAEMLYRSVLDDYAGASPFVAIAESEARHAEALLQLFARRDLAAPPGAWAPAAFAPFGTLASACAAGVVAEQEDAAFYVPYLQRSDLPLDVRNVFANLQAASLENHLPAFESCD